MKRSRSINLDKNSSRRPTEQIDMGRKPTAATPEVGSLGVSGTRELGSYGGISAVGDAAAGITELGAPGVSININPAEQSAKAEVDLGIKQGFGVSFGGEIKRTPTGVSVENVSFGVNVLGFGVNAEGKGNESSKLGISAFGISVEVANDKDGKTSIRLGYEIPGAKAGVTLQPDGEKEEKQQQIPGIPVFPLPVVGRTCALEFTGYSFRQVIYNGYRRNRTVTNIINYNSVTGKGTVNQTNIARNIAIPSQELLSVEDISGSWEISFFRGYSVPAYNVRVSYADNADFYIIGGEEQNIYSYVRERMMTLQNANGNVNNEEIWINTYSLTGGTCNASDGTKIPINNLILVPQNLPNYPQRYKPMNCCDKVEEIYKYLGIAKMKKKFKVAKQFLVPGGTGNEECEDYYALCEALFRMLANGLIINPVSKPLGSEWKNVNATAWASGVYEMVAEAMSNGDTTQKYEISSIMQQVQMMSAIAELSRKVDFLSEAIGTTPDLDTEELPVCFTIHEAHKGFGKKKPKEIDISKPKTDNEVEKVLGTMLQPSKIPIVKWVFRPEAISIAAALSKL
jgi:hypothetical protein